MNKPATRKEVLDLLIAAREYLAKPGVWAQGPTASSVKRACASNALGHGDTPLDRGVVITEAQRILTLCLPSKNTTIVRFNDREATTLEDVKALYDRAIRYAATTEELE